MKRRSVGGFTLTELLIFVGVMALLATGYGSYVQYRDGRDGSYATKAAVSNLFQGLDRYYITQSNIRNQTDPNTCNQLTVTLNALQAGSHIDTRLISDDFFKGVAVRFVSATVAPFIVVAKEVEIDFGTTAKATSIAATFSASYQSGSVLTFREPIPLKGSKTTMGRLGRDVLSGCWRESTNL